MKRISVRAWSLTIVSIAVVVFLVQGWLPLRGKTPTTPQSVKLTNVPSSMVGTPKFRAKSRPVSFEGISIPDSLTKEDVTAIGAQVGRVDTIGEEVSRLEACWDDIVIAVRVRVGKSIVFLVKDPSDGWQVLTVIKIQH